MEMESRIAALEGSPAHAGIDLKPGDNAGEYKGFPRTRGDRPSAWDGVDEYLRVPPHTRG